MRIVCVIALCILTGCARGPTSAVPPGFKYPELGESLEIMTPVSATRLAGKVLDQTGIPIKQALVEVIGESRSKRIAARFTNEDGWFEFSGMKGSEFSIKVTKPGFKPLFATVKIERSAPKQLDITMYVAT